MGDLRTPLRNARGLGSAKEGTGHWIVQRATAIALIPLIVWFMATMIAKAGAGHAEVTAFLAQPLVGILTVLLVVAAFHHMRLGLQVVIEDYIGKEGTRIALLLLVNFLAIGLGVAAVFAVLKIGFAG